MPTGMFSRPLTLEQRFWANVDKHGPDECWPCLRSREIWREGRNETMMCVSFELHVRKLNHGERPRHTCGNDRCANPSHMVVRSRKPTSGYNTTRGSITHCKRGHEYTPENTRRDSRGYRKCVICVRDTSEAFDKAHPDRRRAQRQQRYHERKAARQEIPCPQ